jgi:hypothetical protein
MSNPEREALIEQANTLGLDFGRTISTPKLRAMVEEAQGPAVKPEAEPEAEAPVPTAKATKRELTPDQKLRQRIAEARKKALTRRVVTVTNKDPRENDVVTTVMVSVENEHFAAGRNVPLDIPVALEQCLIENLESIRIPMHKDEIKDGRRTGNKVTTMVKKYVISYSDIVPD